MADDFAAFRRKVDKLEREYDGRALQDKLHKIGQESKKDVAEAVTGDLGDQSMSNWWRGRAIQIVGRYDFPSDHEIAVTPAPRARGPFRVLEDGRQSGGAFDMVQVGRVRKDGTRRGRSRGRNQGATAAKNTWSDAEQLLERRTPDRVDKYVVKAAIRKADLD
jgi:hypothetical protein